MGLKKRLWIIGGLSIVVLCLVSVILLLNKPQIIFQDEPVMVNIHSDFQPMSYITEVKGYDKKDITVDIAQLNMDKLGKYEIIYQVDNKKYPLQVEVVDTQSPTFEIINIEVDLGVSVSCDQMVKNIQDETQTKTYFKEDYDFSLPGDYDVIVVVEDEAGNKTEHTGQVKVIKDDEKPTLSGMSDISVYKNQKIDYLKGVTAKDNRDPDPQIKIDDSQVNLSVVGTYIVEYIVTDRSNNQAVYKRKVYVKEKQNIVATPANGNKIVYLTFDDGPSTNTAKILDILNQYNVKATFFVTGNGQSYNHLIKRAYNEGHTIGLHTYTHDYAKVYASIDAYFDDLTKVGNMVKEQIGFVPKYIRFPGGSSNKVSAKYSQGIMSILVREVQNRGYQYYDWNVSSEDASGNNVPVNQIVKNSTSSNANNIMILMHDTKAKNTTVEALPQIIEYYQAKGYVFKGIDDSSYTPHHSVNN